MTCGWCCLPCPSGFAPPHFLHGQCWWAWEVFTALGAVSLFLAADAPSWDLYLFSSTSPKEEFPLFSVHQNSKVVLKLSAAVGPRDMLFILSLLSWLGSFSLSVPAVDNIQLAPNAWQCPPLLTYGLGCLSPLVSHASVPTRAPFWQEMCCSQPKAQLLFPCIFMGSCWSTGREHWNIGTFYFRTNFCS